MTPAHAYRLGLVQMACGDDPAANLAAALGHLQQAADQGANLICLPELFRTRYFCQREDASHFDLAETIPGPTTAAVAAVCQRRGVTAIVPVFERRAAGVYHNAAVIIGPDGAGLGVYRKMHIPDDPGYHEKYYFAPGDLGFRTFDTAVGRIGVLICWDQWYPEAARVAALRGATLLLYPTAIGWLPRDKPALSARQRAAWQTVQRAHAITNGVYVAAANRTGWEPAATEGGGIEFWGSSFVCSPEGEVVAEAPVDREAVLLADIDPACVEQFRRGWPFLRDRRVDAYGDLLQRYADVNPGRDA